MFRAICVLFQSNYFELPPRPHDKFIRERFSDMAKNIRERRLDRAADESIEMKTLELKEEDDPEVNPIQRRAKVERSTSRKETLGEGSRRRRSEMRKKMWDEMEGRDSGGGGGGAHKGDIGDNIGHVTDDLKDDDVRGKMYKVVQVDFAPKIEVLFYRWRYFNRTKCVKHKA